VILYRHFIGQKLEINAMKMADFWDAAPCSLVETDVSEALAVSIIRAMMEAVRTSETSVNFYQSTRRNIPEEIHLHTRRRENLKSRKLVDSVPFAYSRISISRR
jgi:hypothetical protein